MHSMRKSTDSQLIISLKKVTEKLPLNIVSYLHKIMNNTAQYPRIKKHEEHRKISTNMVACIKKKQKRTAHRYNKTTNLI